jgi:hypothetical protein
VLGLAEMVDDEDVDSRRGDRAAAGKASHAGEDDNRLPFENLGAAKTPGNLRQTAHDQPVRADD